MAPHSDGAPGAAAVSAARRRRLAVAVAVAVALGVSMLTDRSAAAWIQAHRTLGFDDMIDPVAELGATGTPLVIAMLLAGLGLALDLPRLVRIGVLVFASGAATAACVAVLKPLISSGAHAHATGHSWLLDRWGRFPSGHAAIAFAVATALTGEVRAVSVIAYLAATLVCVERLNCGAHVPSEIIAGAVLGTAVARWIGSRDRWRREAPRQASAAPTGLRRVWEQARPLVGALLVLAAPMLFNLGRVCFFDPDEGRYASIPYEMVVSGDFVTPRLNHLLYFEKPPLLYWGVAGAFEVFGHAEWAARLVPAAAATAGVVAAFVLARRMFGPRAGAFAAVVLGGSLIWPGMGRYLTTDMLFTALVFSALAIWWCGHVRTDGRRWPFDVAFWVVVALAVLTKGPVGLVLVAGSIGLYALATRRLRDLLRPGFLATSLVAVAIAAPWFVVVSSRNPSFDRFFWYEQHLGRFFGFRERDIHPGPPWLYFEFLPAMFLPWTALLPGVFMTGWARAWPARTEQQRAKVFLACGCVFVTLFFSASAGKLQIYALPVIPLLAVGLGGWLAAVESGEGTDEGARSMRFVRLGARGIAAALVVVAVVGAIVGTPLLRTMEELGPGLIVASAALLVAWAAVLWIAARRGRLVPIVAATAAGSAAVVVFLAFEAPTLVPNHTFAPLVRCIEPGLAAGAELIADGGFMQSAPYYTGRRIALFEVTGETEFGVGELSADERALWFGATFEDARRRMASAGPVYCIVRDHAHAADMVRKLGNGAREIVWNQRRSIVGNAAAAVLTPPHPGGLLANRCRQLP
jgi:4-amino-4-deoxy-L-arabinose transferase-like glycosyltransferase/membrane-associated phospholipid phosphatase